MLYAYFVESTSQTHDNSDIIKTIKDLDIKMNQVYLDEGFDEKSM